MARKIMFPDLPGPANGSRTLEVAVLALVLACTLRAATVSGVVLDNAGNPVAGATVSLEGTFPKTSTARGPVVSLGKAGSVQTGANGAFTLTGIPASTYFVCVEAESQALINPCRWEATVTMVTLGAADAKNVGNISLNRGYDLQLFIAYGAAFHASAASQAGLKDLRVGVWMPGGFFRQGTLLNDAAGGRTYHVLIPYQVGMNLGIHTSTLVLIDATGAVFDTSTAKFNVLATTAGPVAVPTLTIVGVLPTIAGGVIYVPTTSGKPATIMFQGKFR